MINIGTKAKNFIIRSKNEIVGHDKKNVRNIQREKKEIKIPSPGASHVALATLETRALRGDSEKKQRPSGAKQRKREKIANLDNF